MKGVLSHMKRKKQSVTLILIYFLIILLLVAIDQTSKLLIANNLSVNSDITVIGNVLHFYYMKNSGAALSSMQNMRWFLIPVTVVMISVCAWIIATHKFSSRIANISLMLIIAGGFGNLIDRIFRGYVIDFIFINFISFFTFNIADFYVTMGAIMLCIYLIFSKANLKSHAKPIDP